MGPGRRPGEPELSDEELVARCRRQRSPEAFTALVERYQDRVYTLTRRLLRRPDEAEDAAQETFVRAFQALGTFRRGSRFYTWLYRIAVNCCHTYVRRRYRDRELGGLSLDAPLGDAESGETLQAVTPADDGDPAETVEREETGARVRDALAGLTADYREVLVLRDVERLSYEEIAETLDSSTAAVRARLHRARTELAGKLRDLAP